MAKAEPDAAPSFAAMKPGEGRTAGTGGLGRGRSSGRLSSYTRSLLHIQVPVVVTLAAKKQPVGQIVELGPGSIIHFDKSCEDMLDLSVGGHRIAQGEAVKVGDKFGLRITSLILPEERFKAVGGKG
ncbi:MAG TPA: FliM/FliN family flagellar motor C-terminal domain-containing protein [Pirellulales bacterium]|jgi:flagellar motor switch protein FliN|nr:FliM/FliN family flagellar motor C-terminal domain-containing protein [Pirellulales bacterium]